MRICIPRALQFLSSLFGVAANHLREVTWPVAVVTWPLAVVTWPMAVVTWPLAVLAIAIAITIAILVKVLMQGGVVTAGRPGDYGRAYLTTCSDALTNEKLPYCCKPTSMSRQADSQSNNYNIAIFQVNQVLCKY